MKPAETILQELTAATHNLPYISETDAAWEIIRWPGPDAPTPATIRDWAGHTDEPARPGDLLQMFRAPTTAHEGLAPEGLARVERYRRLLDLLQESLTEISVTRFGTVELTIYIWGCTASGQWLGLKTHASETG